MLRASVVVLLAGQNNPRLCAVPGTQAFAYIIPTWRYYGTKISSVLIYGICYKCYIYFLRIKNCII